MPKSAVGMIWTHTGIHYAGELHNISTVDSNRHTPTHYSFSAHLNNLLGWLVFVEPAIAREMPSLLSGIIGYFGMIQVPSCT
jgi:hypothetical protein